MEIKFLIIFCYSLFATRVSHGDEDQALEWIEPASCAKNKNEFFHTDSLACKKCPDGLAASDDGYGCVCSKNNKIVISDNGKDVCVPCGTGKTRTIDGRECITCRENGRFCGCLENEIAVEKYWNGTILDVQQCLPCPKNFYSSIDRSQCLPCFDTWSRKDREVLILDDPYHEILRKHCVPRDAPKDWPDIQNTYTVPFGNKKTSIDSYFFRTELRFAYYSCEIGIKNACVQLANMCSLTLFSTNSMPCKLFLRRNDMNDRSRLFYREDEARAVLNRRTIAHRYSLDQKDPLSNRLKLVVARFGLRGSFEKIGDANLPCNFFTDLPFGVNLLKRCKIPVSELINTKMTFFVPYLSHSDQTNLKKRILHQLPVLIKNVNDELDSDITRWRLVGRFFSIDKITGYKAISNSKNISFAKDRELQILRYVKSISLIVKLQERSERGKIFPPLLIIEYDELKNREIIANDEVSIEYSVRYTLSDDETNGAIEVFIGVFTGLAIAFSAVQAWSHSRRNNKNVASFGTIFWFIIYCCGTIGNVLLIVCSGYCIHTFIFYKGQKVVHILLPNPGNEWTVKICTIVAFAFKTVEILALIYHQRRLNIFFIDWEQPRTIDVLPIKNLDTPRYPGRYVRSPAKLESNERSLQTASEVIGALRKKISSPARSTSRTSTPSSHESVDGSPDPYSPPVQATVRSERDFSIDERCEEKNNSVSIWRTCMVANEWLRLRTTRKINILLQILTASFFLEIAGGKNWSKAVPELSLEVDESSSVDESFTLKYAVGILVYLIIYTAQWWFSVFVYQKYVVNELQEFVDLCSMANISIFILSHDYYGYYIHGRSVHGFADTDLLTLIQDLKREENNLCAHRGLIPGTTEQTFVISVSKTFKTVFERLLGLENSRNGRFLRNVSNDPADWDERWKVHLRLRKFLTGFIDHCYKNVDYTIKERHCLEKMCEFEITDVDEKSIFYIDNAYSFDRTIFYGNECTLASFEINIFLLVLVFGGNYILALFVLLLVAKTIKRLSRFNGKRLLASKTFIDERFLVSQ